MLLIISPIKMIRKILTKLPSKKVINHMLFSFTIEFFPIVSVVGHNNPEHHQSHMGFYQYK